MRQLQCKYTTANKTKKMYHKNRVVRFFARPVFAFFNIELRFLLRRILLSAVEVDEEAHIQYDAHGGGAGGCHTDLG